MTRGLEVIEAHPDWVTFTTTGRVCRATVEQLDRAQERVAKKGDAVIGSNAVVEADLIEIRRQMREAADHCRKCGAETTRTDGLCDLHNGAAEDHSVQLRGAL